MKLNEFTHIFLLVIIQNLSFIQNYIILNLLKYNLLNPDQGLTRSMSWVIGLLVQPVGQWSNHR